MIKILENVVVDCFSSLATLRLVELVVSDIFWGQEEDNGFISDIKVSNKNPCSKVANEVLLPLLVFWSLGQSNRAGQAL